MVEVLLPPARNDLRPGDTLLVLILRNNNRGFASSLPPLVGPLPTSPPTKPRSYYLDLRLSVWSSDRTSRVLLSLGAKVPLLRWKRPLPRYQSGSFEGPPVSVWISARKVFKPAHVETKSLFKMGSSAQTGVQEILAPTSKRRHS